MLTVLLGVLCGVAPDLIVTGAKLTGGDAFSVTGTTLTAVGRASDLLKTASKQTRVIDVGGRVLLPGLIDSHAHFVSGGLGNERLDLNEQTTLAAMLDQIKAARPAQKSAWVLGRGWHYDLFERLPSRAPTRQMLDAIVPDSPVFLRAYDGHTGWANSVALKLAGIDGSTADLPAGRIGREADGKTPSGVLFEDAMALVMDKIPRESAAQRRAAILWAQEQALRFGLVAINEFAASTDMVDAYLALDAEGLLKLQVFFSPPLETPLAQAIALRERLAASRHVHFGSLKGFVDGVFESGTAVTLAPLSDAQHTHAEPALNAKMLAELIIPADKAGFSVSLHAIGDRAVRLALDVYALAAKTNNTRDRRHRIEHIELIDPADLQRFSALGVLASMQPFHAEPADVPGQGVWETNIGPARMPFTFAWRALRDAGATLAFGSDWPVMSLDPLRGIAVATSRRNGHGLPPDGWIAKQKLGFDEAVQAYTSGAAHALHAEQTLGTLAVGRPASFVVLSNKVSVSEPLSLYWGSVDLTVIDGEVVYEPWRQSRNP